MKKEIAVINLGDCRLPFYETRRHIAEAETAKLVNRLEKKYTVYAPAPVFSIDEGLAVADEIRKRLDGTSITESALKELVAKKGYYTTDVPLEDYSDEVLNGWILKNWTKIVDMLTPKN